MYLSNYSNEHKVDAETIIIRKMLKLNIINSIYRQMEMIILRTLMPCIRDMARSGLSALNVRIVLKA